MKTEMTMVCSDQVILKGNIHHSEENPKAVVVINPATGAKTSYYYPFADFLNRHGFVVVTWNYRGFCESKDRPLNEVDYHFSDVGLKDIPTVFEFVKKEFPDLPMLCVGHSVGGQQIGLAMNNHYLKGLVAVASSVGYPGFMPISYRLQAYYFFHLFSPISIFFKGYVASAKFGIMEDLPKNVLIDWRNWCLKKDYFFDPAFYGVSVPKGNYDQLSFPVQVMSATDDPISNKRAVSQLWGHIKSSKAIEFTWYRPQDLGLKSIGHFGYFEKSAEKNIWADIKNALEGFLQRQ